MHLNFRSPRSILTPLALGLASVLALGTSTPALLAQTSDLPGEGITLRPTATSLQEEIFSADVASIGLRELGYEIEELKELDYAIQLAGIANQELDFTGLHVEQVQAGFFEGAGGTDRLQRVGKLYDLNQGYLIDKATAEEYGLETIDQLQDPDLAEVFDTDGDGKANLVGCDPGWGCNGVIAHHLEVYDLEDTVEQDSGSYSVLVADMVTRYEQGEPVLYYFYTPYWLHDVLRWDEDVVALGVPYTDLPDEQSELTEADTTREGLNYGFVIDAGRFVVSNAFAEENPAVVKLLEQIAIPTEDVNAISRRITEGEDDREDIQAMAEEWVENNQEQFDQWVAEALAVGS